MVKTVNSFLLKETIKVFILLYWHILGVYKLSFAVFEWKISFCLHLSFQMLNILGLFGVHFRTSEIFIRNFVRLMGIESHICSTLFKQMLRQISIHECFWTTTIAIREVWCRKDLQKFFNIKLFLWFSLFSILCSTFWHRVFWFLSAKNSRSKNTSSKEIIPIFVPLHPNLNLVSFYVLIKGFQNRVCLLFKGNFNRLVATQTCLYLLLRTLHLLFELQQFL